MNLFSFRIAGNTEAPCYHAIIAKGFTVTMQCNITTSTGDDCLWTIEAIKNDHVFSATTMQELLGLIAMWEIRGDDWTVSDDECNYYFDEIRDKAPIYDFDGTEIVE